MKCKFELKTFSNGTKYLTYHNGNYRNFITSREYLQTLFEFNHMDNTTYLEGLIWVEKLKDA